MAQLIPVDKTRCQVERRAMPDVMTVTHPRWNEFTQTLEGPDGCNCREEAGQFLWDCSGPERKHARRVLEAMGMDVEKSLAYFDELGGHCDCEILFNVGE